MGILPPMHRRHDSEQDLPFRQANEAFTSLKLEGSRFDYARMPVETLQELLRYRMLIVSAATEQWQREHPDDEVPDSLQSGLDLALTEVAPGSAIPLLTRPTEADFDEEFERARDSVDQLLRDVSTGSMTRESFPQWANLPQFWEFGSSLKGSEALYVPAPSPRTAESAVITQQAREDFFEPLKVKVRGQRSEGFGLVQGKIVAINAENRNFDLTTESNPRVHGRFKSETLIDKLRSVLDSSAKASPILLLGRNGYKDGALEKILEAVFVTHVDSDYAASAKRLQELSEIEKGWLGPASEEGRPEPSSEEDGPGFAGETISQKTLLLGAHALSCFNEAGFPPPSIFPSEYGGLSFEWVTAKFVCSVEIEPDGTVTAYCLPPESMEGTEEVLDEIDDLPMTIREWNRFLSLGALAHND